MGGLPLIKKQSCFMQVLQTELSADYRNVVHTGNPLKNLHCRVTYSHPFLLPTNTTNHPTQFTTTLAKHQSEKYTTVLCGCYIMEWFLHGIIS